MHPVLADMDFIGRHFEVKAYTVFLVLAVIAVIATTVLTAYRRGLPALSVLLCMISAGTAAFIGARILHVLINPGLYTTNPWRILSTARTGFSLYGGILAAAAAVWVWARLTRLHLWRLADSIAMALGPGIILVRIGCLLNGCCYGRPTDMPWGLVFPTTTDAKAQAIIGFFGLPLPAPVPQPVHPTQVYEIVAALIGIVIVLLLLRYQKADGVAFLGFSVWFTAYRWFNWHLREIPESFSAPPWFYPALYGFLIIASLVMIAVRVRSVHNISLTEESRQQMHA